MSNRSPLPFTHLPTIRILRVWCVALSIVSMGSFLGYSLIHHTFSPVYALALLRIVLAALMLGWIIPAIQQTTKQHTLHQPVQSKRYYALFIGLLLGIVYQGGWTDTSLIIGILTARGFFFFDSRLLAWVTLVYLLHSGWYLLLGNMATAENTALYTFWYILCTIIITHLEGHTA